MIDEETSKLLVFFSALSDANRLKIVGLLAQKEYSVEELAEMLGLRPSTVSHHLSKLSKVGLVSARAESYYNIYQLNKTVLEMMAKSLLAKDTLPKLALDIDLGAYDRKVVRDFTGGDGRLKSIPSQRKKLAAVLRFVVQTFEVGREYTQAEANGLLKRYHDDTATLRRELVGYRMLERDKAGNRYWRPAAPEDETIGEEGAG